MNNSTNIANIFRTLGRIIVRMVAMLSVVWLAIFCVKALDPAFKPDATKPKLAINWLDAKAVHHEARHIVATLTRKLLHSLT
ncbi:hypothetical protein C2869_09290 [Saccharobesus litoralis]|uniref:Uncharacterized protein n=1 Tax=Saccharobesus litoralis TaxID=2172099 RepID=A0A2S0VQW9_9ALTE|nr:hypothetical protein [Saccharobesus litoralis]AWB66611.1 hypothetical protein C2869_09290 [Saccharobesus litoralis]